MVAKQRLAVVGNHVRAVGGPVVLQPGMVAGGQEMLRRFEEERVKRLEATGHAGNAQYMHLGAQYEIDPYSEPMAQRSPITKETEILIIGAGFGGLLAAAELRQVGVRASDLLIVERGGDVGGTWYWNRYPGVMCDVESYSYMPLLEELNYIPSETYAKGPEIFAHCQAVARKFDLYPSCVFQTTVTETRWDEHVCRWCVETSRGDRVQAKFVVMANGSLTQPKVPRLDGIDSFKGRVFHTARWDYAFTGKDLRGLEGLRVGIIGTGATAVQVVPQVAKAAGHVVVFQRTPSGVFPQNNKKTDPKWAAQRASKPGWSSSRRKLMDKASEVGITGAVIQAASSMKEKPKQATDAPAKKASLQEMFQAQQISAVRALHQRVESIVKDPATAESLKPYYFLGCKRPCFHDEFLQSFNRPNVTLVDTEGLGVEGITPEGVVACGKEHKVDVLIFATGFEVGKLGVYNSVLGAGGQPLAKKLGTRGGAGGGESANVSTLFGINTRGFPNFFVLQGPQSAFPFNQVSLLAQQSHHVARVVRYCRDHGVRVLEPAEVAEASWTRTIVSSVSMEGVRAFLSMCTPGYYNNEGQTSSFHAQSMNYGKGALAYYELLHGAREENFPELFDFTYEPEAAQSRAGAGPSKL